MTVFDTIKNQLINAAESTASEVADAICEDIKDRLLAGNHYRTGRLYNSVTYEENTDGSADIVAEDYLQYIEGGQLLDDCIRDGLANANEILTKNVEQEVGQGG